MVLYLSTETFIVVLQEIEEIFFIKATARVFLKETFANWIVFFKIQLPIYVRV